MDADRAGCCGEEGAAAPRPTPLVNFSSLDVFENCERQYWYRHVDGQEKPENETLFVGTLYHSVIANFLASSAVNPQDAGRRIEEITGQELDKVAAGIKQHHLSRPALRAEISANVISLYHDVIHPARLSPLMDKDGPRIERHFENPMTGFRGTCDLVSATTPVVNPRGAVTGSLAEPCIIDWKTLTSFNRRSQKDADRSMQLALYAWESDVMNAAFVEIPRQSGRDIVVRVTHYTPAQRIMWVNYLQGQRTALLSRGKARENFKRASRKSGLCDPQWCPYYADCLGMEHLTEGEEGDKIEPCSK